MKQKKLLVIGWDAADWKVINPLIQDGKMPALKKLIERGVFGNLKTLDPPLSPMLWTSMATGVRPYKHGIGGFVEPRPDGEGLRPVSSSSRKVKAIWNMFHNYNKKSNIVSWWPSNPVEPINGVMVSNLFHIANSPTIEDWKLGPSSVHPDSIKSKLGALRVHPEEMTLNMISPFIPNIIKDKDLRKEKRTLGVAKVLANASSVHAISTYLQSETEWDFMAVYHDAIDHFCHLAMKYHPPKRDHIDQEDFDNFKLVVEAAYRFHDMMLERTIDLMDDDTTLMLISDHGFHSDHQRPLFIPKEPSGPATEHSPYGIFVMAGPGVKKGGIKISGASILDITPTILSFYNMPIGKDMDGKVLSSIYEIPQKDKYIDSWENIPGDFGGHTKESIEDPWSAQEALQQLVELGYIEAVDDKKLDEIEKAKRESRYYMARGLINGGDYQKAIEILEEIFEESKIIRYGQRLAFAYLSCRRYLKCQNIIDQLRIVEKEAFELKTNEKADFYLNKEFEDPLYLDYVDGLLNLHLNRPKKALPKLEKVQKKSLNNIEVALNIAKIHNLRKNFSAAERQFIHALSIDDSNSVAHYGLGVSLLKQNKKNEAIDEFLMALEGNFYMPNAHFFLGIAFYSQKLYNESCNAFEVAIRLSPGMTKAHNYLLDIYTSHLPNDEKRYYHKEFLDKNIKGERIIITGLIGSGTDLLVSFIQSLGLDIHLKKQTKKNQRNYILDEVKNLNQDKSFLFDLKKLIYVNPQYLSFLPSDYNYKVLWVQQDLDEVLKSDYKILGKKLPNDTIPIKQLNAIEKNQEKILDWIEINPLIHLFKIDFSELIDPDKELELGILDFLNPEV